MVEGTRHRTPTMKNQQQKTSFLKALISKDARDKREQEKTKEAQAKKKRNAKIEASALLFLPFLVSLTWLPHKPFNGFVALLICCIIWQLTVALSYRYGPLVPARRPGKRSKQQSVFYGPRGGRYRMSTDGKSRIYF